MKVYDRRRAIYDVNALTPYYPIYTKSGKGGGIFIANDYKLDRLYLTDEQSALLEELLPTLTESKAEIMKSILKTFKLNK